MLLPESVASITTDSRLQCTTDAEHPATIGINRIFLQLRNPNERHIAHLPKDKFEKVPIPLPPTLAEQTAIATILSDMDNRDGVKFFDKSRGSVK